MDQIQSFVLHNSVWNFYFKGLWGSVRSNSIISISKSYVVFGIVCYLFSVPFTVYFHLCILHVCFLMQCGICLQLKTEFDWNREIIEREGSWCTKQQMEKIQKSCIIWFEENCPPFLNLVSTFLANFHNWYFHLAKTIDE